MRGLRAKNSSLAAAGRQRVPGRSAAVVRLTSAKFRKPSWIDLGIGNADVERVLCATRGCENQTKHRFDSAQSATGRGTRAGPAQREI
jgi:hypothetical protein